MKKGVLFIVMCLSAIGMMAQTFYKAVINDPDGYTNVRKGQSTNTTIVMRILEGEEFFVQKGKTNWWPVYLDKKGPMKGYIHNSRVKIINDSPTPSTPLSAEDDAAVRSVVSELMQKAVAANNAYFKSLGPELDDDAIIGYCSSSMKALWRKYIKIAEAYDAGTIKNNDVEAYFCGDGNHALAYYLLHGGDPDFCEWDEITNILKWEIKSVVKTAQGALATVSIYQESCYEDAKRHTFMSKLKLVKEDGQWKFSDLNCYISSEQTTINKFYRLLGKQHK